jgi:hypothetical protein
MDLKRKTKITRHSQEDVECDGFRSPSNFYIVDCMGDLVFISAKKRQTAQQWADAEYGDGKYTVRLWKIQ